MGVQSKMGWNDLPFEMKCEVFKYLNQNERFKFAKCSFSCLNEVIHEEKEIWLVEFKGIKRADGKLLILKIAYIELEFMQVGKLCEIKWNYEIIWKIVGNGKTMAYKFCENVLARHKNNIRSLNLSKVDFMIRDKSIDNFPKLEVLTITTNNEKQLYSWLSKAENLEDLTVNFRDFGNTEKIRFPGNSKLSKIDNFNLVSNNANVALKIIDKMNKPKDKYFEKVNVSIIDGKYAVVNEKFINFFKKCENLTTNLILTDDQFSQLMLSCRYLKLNAEKVNYSTISRLIENCIKNGISKELQLTNVHGLEKQLRDFKWLRERKKEEWIHEAVPNKYFIYSFISCVRGSYNSSTGRLIFHSF
ncbi:unnamed protein product [Caenorhabditis angaria]|uniref:F-box domain-containing protein n=1 Tax=Caenorhabditis angaria TaxID=860376 RepID=A0A9P1I8L2_9PELO|nr:unnamed protein product [Caenorhabditis angaria]